MRKAAEAADRQQEAQDREAEERKLAMQYAEETLTYLRQNVGEAEFKKIEDEVSDIFEPSTDISVVESEQYRLEQILEAIREGTDIKEVLGASYKNWKGFTDYMKSKEKSSDDPSDRTQFI